jgi:hypothetical protein
MNILLFMVLSVSSTYERIRFLYLELEMMFDTLEHSINFGKLGDVSTFVPSL